VKSLLSRCAREQLTGPQSLALVADGRVPKNTSDSCSAMLPVGLNRLSHCSPGIKLRNGNAVSVENALAGESGNHALVALAFRGRALLDRKTNKAVSSCASDDSTWGVECKCNWAFFVSLG
jgi:hypothetical protein